MAPKNRALTIHLDSISVEGRSLTVIATPQELGLPTQGRMAFADPVHVELNLSKVSGKLLVQGSAKTSYSAICDRCLDPYEKPLDVPDICLFFDDTDNEEIDLTEALREDILLNFPQRLLCSEGCPGLCPGCGRPLVDGVCNCQSESSDESPWRALDGLKTD